MDEMIGSVITSLEKDTDINVSQLIIQVKKEVNFILSSIQLL